MVTIKTRCKGCRRQIEVPCPGWYFCSEALGGCGGLVYVQERPLHLDFHIRPFALDPTTPIALGNSGTDLSGSDYLLMYSRFAQAAT